MPHRAECIGGRFNKAWIEGGEKIDGIAVKVYCRWTEASSPTKKRMEVGDARRWENGGHEVKEEARGGRIHDLGMRAQRAHVTILEVRGAWGPTKKMAPEIGLQ